MSARSVSLRALALPPLALAVTAAGIGWLYLLRRAAVLSPGPHLAEALPLQRLAGEDSQPLARLVVAWLPSGVFGGLALAAAGIPHRWARAALLGGSSLVVLGVFGALADSVTASDPLRMHLAQQPQRAATWVAAGLVALGAAVAGDRRARQR